MSVESEILRIQHNIANAYAAVADKGGEVPLQTTSANLVEAISSIPIGASIQSLKVIHPPKYTSYAVGESFDTTGLEVHGIFSNGVEIPIPNELLISCPETIGSSTNSVSVSFCWYEGNSASVAFQITIQEYPHSMNYCTWQQLSELSASNRFTEFYSIGDAKEFKMTWQYAHPYLKNQTMSCIVIGVNHNSEREGSNRLHCMITVGNSTDKVLVDENYGHYAYEQTNTFCLNWGDTNIGGFSATPLKKDALASFRNSLPEDLRNILKSATKWDDTGSSNNQNDASAITSHSYDVAIPSAIEICGQADAANYYEKNYQSQYPYFSNTQRQKFQKYSDGIPAKISTRTRYLTSSQKYFNCIDENGKQAILNATQSVGLLPIIFI